MKIVILHAYSATNSGDGLLVDEAIALCRAAHIDPDIVVLALDPESFSLPGIDVIHPFTGLPTTPSSVRVLSGALASWLRGARLPRSTRAVVESSDRVVGVGGGYLRGGNPAELLKMLLAHAPQLPTSSYPRTVYLPQSVGPLRFGSAAILRGRIARVGQLDLRDGRSMRELAAIGNTTRITDSALLGIAGGLDESARVASGTAGIGLVARALHASGARRDGYEASLQLIHQTDGAIPLVQASARGNDDAAFYKALGWQGEFPTLRVATSKDSPGRPGAVISVRLHGAIQSIRNGVPAVHLSYERKGWGAYEDLGLPEFVHNAFDFDPDLVIRQAESLRDDSSSYWAAVDRALPQLSMSRNQVVAQLRGGMRTK